MAPLCRAGRIVRILEVGLRTGGLAECINDQLSEWGTAGLIDYVASDLAKTFFPDAQARLARFPWVKLQRFNIEADAETQGLVSAAFDVVVVFSTLHGIANINIGVSQLAGILAPGGILINVEPSEADQWFLMDMWFGAFDVWTKMR